MRHILAEAKKSGVVPWDDPVDQIGDVTVYADGFPVAHGHRLFVPAQDSEDAVIECFRQAYRMGHVMVSQGLCDAFNIGMNQGAAAGQTVMYPHEHLIPRRRGDCEDPVGGVRSVIAGQANYRKKDYKNPTDK